jgi:hypothetical protein
MKCGFSIEFSTIRSPNRVLTTLKSASKIRISFCSSFQNRRLGGVNLSVDPCGEHKLRNFKARYLTMKPTIREYSCLGKLAQLF